MESSEQCLLLAANFQNQMRFVVFPIISHLASGPADWPFRAAAVTGHIGVTDAAFKLVCSWRSHTLMHTNWVSHTVE